ncbi:hypothetical protein Q8W71_17785 [Methylobacterium sp. NEAU 140]|uniref:alginate O-acetyltransferase AlgX-related protein n=1 Tax=Methylobacterium sp. NEAU 140 TaxID=3064945 RepID=UPI002735660C|nr:hypothetical protein [Methylobacterium sp. NEAU 140]MDP4024480.1 hypothetical protein [Methylobacterium sp. NEAU 140]
MDQASADHIHVGHDGWLFLISGSNNVVDQFNKSDYMTFQVESWRKIILRRRHRLARMGIVYRHVVVPEKLTIYEDRLDGISIEVALSPARRLPRMFPRRPRRWHHVGGPLDALRLRRTCVDLIEPMRAQRAGADLYFRTDSHWNLAGCLIGYRAVCRAFGARPRDDFDRRPSLIVEHAGDLGSALDPPRTETARVHALQRDAARSYASPIVLTRERAGLSHTLHVGAHVIYANAQASDPRVLVLFGDSYAHFAPSALTIMLAETFREVHFIWSTSVDWAYVERVKPDLVLTEIAERFMFRTPDDRFDLERYAAERFGDEIRGNA